MSGDAAATRYMRKGHHEGTTVCEWSAMRSFVVWDQEHTGPEGRGRDLSVYTYDEKAGQYRFFNLGHDGHHAGPQLAVTGDTVTYTSSNENNGRKTILRTVNKFESAGRHTSRRIFHRRRSELDDHDRRRLGPAEISYGGLLQDYGQR